MADLDLSEFHAASTQHGSRCTLSRIDLPEDQADKLSAALAEPSITGRAISRVLKGWGFEVNPTTVQRHRRRECRCE